MDLISFLPRAVMQGIPLLYGSTGEILTEKSGNLNLGIPGIMYVGGICGVTPLLKTVAPDAVLTFRRNGLTHRSYPPFSAPFPTIKQP